VLVVGFFSANEFSNMNYAIKTKSLGHDLAVVIDDCSLAGSDLVGHDTRRPVSRGDRRDTGKPQKQQNQDAILPLKPM
jgi:hypothetical protein